MLSLGHRLCVLPCFVFLRKERPFSALLMRVCSSAFFYLATTRAVDADMWVPFVEIDGILTWVHQGCCDCVP